MNIDWPNLPGEVVVVVSDIHSNVLALESALKQARSSRMDHLIILGDLLTYGVDIAPTMNLIKKELEVGASIILGNHDQMYIDLMNGDYNYFSKLPFWIQESVGYNLKHLDIKMFQEIAWQKKIIRDDILYSHANPYDDWRYLNTSQEIKEATMVIQKQGLVAGVFGHNHRSICFSLEENEMSLVNDMVGTFFLNPGAIGQPRNKPPISTILRLSSYENKLWAEVEQVIYDTEKHISTLMASDLSDPTKTKLAAFFK